MVNTSRPSGPIQSVWRALFGAGAHLFAEAISPSLCAACDGALERRSAFCPACASTVVRSSAAFSAPAEGSYEIKAFGEFGGALATALRRFKFEGRPDLARPLGQMLRRAAAEAGLRADVVMPVPLHPKRLCERGYNQSALLAQSILDEVSARLDTRTLVRIRQTEQQATLDQKSRLLNVQQAFALQGSVQNLRIVLVDDVYTTGATLQACADILRSGGAANVKGLVLARA